MKQAHASTARIAQPRVVLAAIVPGFETIRDFGFVPHILTKGCAKSDDSCEARPEFCMKTLEGGKKRAQMIHEVPGGFS